MKWIGQHIYDLVARFRNDVYISETLTIGSATDIEPKINIVNDENSVEIGIANATNDMVTGSSDGDLVINSVGDHKIILAQNDTEVITIEDTAKVSFADDITINGSTVTIGATSATVGGKIVFYEGTDNGTNAIRVASPPALTTNTDLYLPDGVGSNGQVLTTDGNNPATLSWTTPTGDITGVTITTDSGGGSAASDTGGSADFSILGSNGVGVTNSGTTITVTAVPGEIDHDSLLNFASNEHFTQANIVATGALNSGSITSGFGNIDIGSSTFDTTGAVSTGIITPVAIKHSISGNNAGDYGPGAEILYGISNDSVTAGEIYVLRAGVWTLIDADILSTVSQLAAVATIAAGSGDSSDGMIIKGCVTLNNAYTAGTDSEGSVVYASTTAGEATLTAPSASNDFVRILGYSLNVSDKKMFFNPDSTWVEIA